MSDSLFWAMKILEEEAFARAVACRFDELIVDEAQDTTDTQLRCIELLKKAGLRSIVCIGDPEQSIYGFAGAAPEALEGMVAQLGLDPLRLDENWRSLLFLRCSGSFQPPTQKADRAVSERRDSHLPELMVYNPDDRHDLSSAESARRAWYRARPCGGAVPATQWTCYLINGTGGAVFKNRLAELANLADTVQHDRPLLAHVVADVEREIARHAWPATADEDHDSDRRYRLRQAVMALAESLPSTALQTSEWAKHSKKLVNDTIAALETVDGQSRSTYKPAMPAGTGALVVRGLLDGRQSPLHARTVHAVKGESYDGTLVVAVTTERFDNVANGFEKDGEERRIAGYRVNAREGLQRARRSVNDGGASPSGVPASRVCAPKGHLVDGHAVVVMSASPLAPSRDRPDCPRRSAQQSRSALRRGDARRRTRRSRPRVLAVSVRTRGPQSRRAPRHASGRWSLSGERRALTQQGGLRPGPAESRKPLMIRRGDDDFTERIMVHVRSVAASHANVDQDRR